MASMEYVYVKFMLILHLMLFYVQTEKLKLKINCSSMQLVVLDFETGSSQILPFCLT